MSPPRPPGRADDVDSMDTQVKAEGDKSTQSTVPDISSLDTQKIEHCGTRELKLFQTDADRGFRKQNVNGQLDEDGEEIEILEPPPKPLPLIVDLEVDCNTNNITFDDTVPSDQETDEDYDLTQCIPASAPFHTQEQNCSEGQSIATNRSSNSNSTLLKMCLGVMLENIDRFESIQEIPFQILEPMLNRISIQQLLRLEHYNPYLRDGTDVIWQRHFAQKFPGAEPKNLESWRDAYNRHVTELDVNTDGNQEEADVAAAAAVSARQECTIDVPINSSTATASLSLASPTVSQGSKTAGATNGSNTRRGRVQQLNIVKDIPVITINSDTPPLSPSSWGPYSMEGRRISDEIGRLQENCYREIKECVNRSCKGTYLAPSDSALAVVALEMPRTFTELEKIPGMSQRVRFIYWEPILKITKNYYNQKFALYKSSVIPLTLQQAKELCDSIPATPKSPARRKAKAAPKRRKLVIFTSDEDNDSSGGSEAPDPTPPAKRPRKKAPRSNAN